jgi:LSD1 subclass zinc finger protein
MKCERCKKEYEYKRGRSTQIKCASCIVNMRRTKLKQKMVEYKGYACLHCGYKNNIKALSFHHLNPEEKDFDISGAHCRSWEALKKELDKCILLCLNCHAELHDEQICIRNAQH